jgi:Coenzyme PQQ synthesis protein D (PqqD)
MPPTEDDRQRGRAHIAGVRTRALPDMECLLVFAPATRTLHWLNLTAWAIFDLCDGSRTDAELVDAYAEALDNVLPEADVARQVLAGLESLERSGLIARPPEQPGIR